MRWRAGRATTPGAIGGRWRCAEQDHRRPEEGGHTPEAAVVPARSPQFGRKAKEAQRDPGGTGDQAAADTEPDRPGLGRWAPRRARFVRSRRSRSGAQRRGSAPARAVLEDAVVVCHARPPLTFGSAQRSRCPSASTRRFRGPTRGLRSSAGLVGSARPGPLPGWSGYGAGRKWMREAPVVPTGRPGPRNDEVEGAGMSPLTGFKIIEIAGIGPGPFGDDAGRHGRRGRPRRPRAERARRPAPATPHGDVLHRGRRSIAVDLKHPDGVETLLDLVEHGRRADRGLPPRRDGAARPRPRRVPRPQPEARLRPHDRLGPGRARTRRRPGHDINYISLAGALAPHRPRRASAPVPPLNLVGDFGGGGMFLAFGVVCALLEAQRSGQGPGRRRGDGRRRRGADDDVLGVPARWACATTSAGHQPARHRRPLLRRLRDAPTASTSRSARSSRSSTPSCCASPGSTATTSSPRRWTSARWPDAEGAARRAVHAPRRATSGARSWSTPTCASRRC